MLTPRSRWLLWITAVVLWVAVWLFPLSNLITRTMGVALLAIVWLGLLALIWKIRWSRVTMLSLSAILGIFLVWPANSQGHPEALRASYLRGLARYRGTHYFWGGESLKGIDCSGLMRRGMIDGMFLQGIGSGDAALVRSSIDLWWHDCTANDLMGGYRGLTVPIATTPSINALDDSALQPGDMAVTDSGVHVLAYLGEKRWIEADPGIGSVVVVTAPARDNIWFLGPMKIVRWKVLQ